MRTAIVIAGMMLASSHASGQEARQEPAPGVHAAGGQIIQSQEEAAIRLADTEFVREYNKADARALAARFTDDAEVVEVDGTRYHGRSTIEQRLTETFAASAGMRLEIEDEAIRFLTPDVAKVEGRTVVKVPRRATESRRHTALLVRRDGRWLISSIREEADPGVPPHDRLKELEWMVGDWVDQGSDANVRVTCRWSEDGNFLIRTFTVKVQGKPAMTVNQRIGWDPLGKRFQSWEFDSEGGYGEGRWSHDGDRWVIKHTGVRPEGVTASATHIMTRERPDLVRWISIDRVVGDESVPQEERFVMVRIPPPPQSPSSSRPANPPAPSETRSPR